MAVSGHAFPGDFACLRCTNFKVTDFCLLLHPIGSNLKLHELFARWLLKPENCVWINVLLSDLYGSKRSEEAIPYPVQSRAGYSPALPGSPVSRLIHHHLPFDGSPRLHRHILVLSSLNQTCSVTSSFAGSNLVHAREGSQLPKDYAASANSHELPNRAEFVSRTSDRGSASHVLNGEDGGSVGAASRDVLEDAKPFLPSLNPVDAQGTSAATSTGQPLVGSSLENNSDFVRCSFSRSMPGNLERFYFPCGRGWEEREAKEREAITTIFKKHKENKGSSDGLARTEFAVVVAQALSLPTFFAPIVFDRVLDATFDSSEDQSYVHTPGDREGLPLHVSSGKEHNIDLGSQRRNDLLGGGGSGSLSGLGVGSDDIDVDVKPMSIDSVANAATERSNPRPTLVTEDRFRRYYLEECVARCREERLFRILIPEGEARDFLTPSDLKAMLSALLMCHQGLSFLHATPEFQLRYSETVIERIFFSCSRTHSGRLTLQDIKRSQLLDTLMMVDEEEDINRERKYFSYEHFYVLYCRFWELDVDHDLQIDREDLMRYGGHSLTYRIVDRIFGGYARRLDSTDHPGFMSYTDFIWFCLSEEDKNSETAVDYWFRCVDMDGDGLITMYDMEYFYKEQLHRMECFGHEPVQIRDILCQLLDMVKPNSRPPHIKRSDLKACRLAGSFFNVLFNLNKFFALEARDPLQIRQEHATPELTDWDRFAALEYLRLSAEEEGEEEEVWEEVHDSINPAIPGEAPF